MVASLEKTMQQLRSCRGADVSAESRVKTRRDLEEDVADAAALLRVATRSGVDSSRLSGKLEAARKLLGKESQLAVDNAPGNGSVTLNLPVAQTPPRPEPPAQSHLSQRGSVTGSIRSSVAARNADERRRRQESIRRQDEDAELQRELKAVELDARKKREAIESRIMEVRHGREENDAEEEDERRSSISAGSSKVDQWLDAHTSQSDASPPRSRRLSHSPTNSYLSSPSFVVRSVASVDSDVAGARPTPKPRASLSRVEPTVSKADVHISNSAGSKSVAKNASSTVLKTALKATQNVTPAPKNATPAVIAASGAKSKARSATPKSPKEKTTPASQFTPAFDAAPHFDAASEDAASTLVKLQSQEFAFRYAVSLRPKFPFDGKSQRIDFDHYLKEFEDAQSTPGLTAKLRLSECRFWFVGLAGLKISRFLLRKDAEAAIAEAIEVLSNEYGKKRTSANEMLEALMAGEKVPQKDVVAVDEFVSRLEAIYYTALDTDRAEEFDKKSLFDSILE